MGQLVYYFKYDCNSMVEGWKENSIEVKINCFFFLPPQLIYTLLSDNTVNEALPKS